MAETPVISLKFNNDTPVDLISFTNSLSRFGAQYKRFAKTSDIPLVSEEYRLYISEVRKGSIEVDLVSAVGTMAAVIGDVRLFYEFGKEFTSLVHFFLGKGPKPESLDKITCENMRTIMAPVAENSGSVLNMTIGDQAHPVINISVNSVEANAIQNRALSEIKTLKTPQAQTYEEVLLRWHQAEKAPGAPSGPTSDKAIIEEIDERPIKAYFPEKSQDIKTEMINGDENFFTKAYLVDVEALVTNNTLVGYKILRLHETFDQISG